jgi:HK97 family phage portal protein
MSWWTRWVTELRSLFPDPNTPASLGIWGVPSVSGEPVTLERACSLSAVWSCVTLISGSIASMPLVLYRKTDEGREKAVEHPLFDVLRYRPNANQSVVSFWETLITSVLLRGNGYAMLARDDTGAVRGMWPLSADRVSVEVLKTGRPRYQVQTPTGPTVLPAESMLHIVGPLSDGYQGKSVISACRETLALGLALERYGSEYFSESAQPRGVLSTPMTLSTAATAKLRDSIAAVHQGPGKRHGTMVLEGGMKFETVALSPEDSQFLESRRFSVEEIARVFGVPPHMIGADIKGSMTYSNTELESLRLVKHTLGPWLSRIESAVAFSCISPLERRVLYPEFLADALLAPATAERYAAYQVGVSGGWLTVDEVRAKENLPPLPERIPAVG